jgi:hypothetical protein
MPPAQSFFRSDPVFPRPAAQHLRHGWNPCSLPAEPAERIRGKIEAARECSENGEKEKDFSSVHAVGQ